MSAITIHPSIKVAQAVLAAMEVLLDDDDHRGLVCSSYSNGREQGYTFTNRRNYTVAVAQYRNTDQIVVYMGKMGDFRAAGHAPSDEVYNRKRLFAPDDIMGAARAILEFFN